VISLDRGLVEVRREVQGNFLPGTCNKDPDGEYRYNSTLPLTSGPDKGGWSTPRHGRFTPGKETRYLMYRRLGGSPGPVWTGAENLTLTGIRSLDLPDRNLVAVRGNVQGEFIGGTGNKGPKGSTCILLLLF